MGTGPLVPGAPPLVSGSCASPRAFGLGFLETPPRGDALALLLAFGSAQTWHEDLHLAHSVPCLAHTAHAKRRAVQRVPSSAGLAGVRALRLEHPAVLPDVDGAVSRNEGCNMALEPRYRVLRQVSRRPDVRH
jgi:hypothetical protein